ncbi:MAG: aminodeoxychorismate/anthranilate synthase component II, partial [Bacteroidia bacterium]|nr:aminodeoxychorismate/anthranilate synthase component II [Bacteroidia bacterium]
HGEIMGLSHENQLIKGVQFHPESILTEWGKELINNWLYKC